MVGRHGYCRGGNINEGVSMSADGGAPKHRLERDQSLACIFAQMMLDYLNRKRRIWLRRLASIFCRAARFPACRPRRLRSAECRPPRSVTTSPTGSPRSDPTWWGFWQAALWTRPEGGVFLCARPRTGAPPLQAQQFLDGACDGVTARLERSGIPGEFGQVLRDTVGDVQQSLIDAALLGGNPFPARLDEPFQNDEILVILDAIAQHFPADAVDGSSRTGSAGLPAAASGG